jgi:hypothetical protein
MEEINAGYTGFEPEQLFLQEYPEWKSKCLDNDCPKPPPGLDW